MGFEKNVVVATRTDSYVKMQEQVSISSMVYKKYPYFVEALKRRPKMYNDEKEYILDQEKKGTVFFIRPHEELDISRTETNPEKLEKIYQVGRRDAEAVIDKLKAWLEK